MGRTIPSFRVALEREIHEWRDYRKALPKGDRILLDEMLAHSKDYCMEASMAVRPVVFEGMMMSILFSHWKALTGIAQSLKSFREKTEPAGHLQTDQAAPADEAAR